MGASARKRGCHCTRRLFRAAHTPAVQITAWAHVIAYSLLRRCCCYAGAHRRSACETAAAAPS
eukprot:3046601-Pleurochrysis_carterae.AAC.9